MKVNMWLHLFHPRHISSKLCRQIAVGAWKSTWPTYLCMNALEWLMWGRSCVFQGQQRDFIPYYSKGKVVPFTPVFTPQTFSLYPSSLPFTRVMVKSHCVLYTTWYNPAPSPLPNIECCHFSCSSVGKEGMEFYCSWTSVIAAFQMPVTMGVVDVV